MNIQLLTPFTSKINNNRTQKVSNSTNVIHSNLSPLMADTVNFTGSPRKTVKAAKALMQDVMYDTYEKERAKYAIYAKRLMAALESVAFKFKDRGVKFDREYCEHAAVKSTESFFSKFLRSGEKPLDRVRSTLYVDDPHDFKLIDEIISELQDLGYEITNIPGTKKPDFDIRLSNVTAAELKGLRPSLRECVGAPIPTGYEDIQFRIKDSEKKSAPPMEVLIIFGKATANAKIDESKYSYNIRRALKKLLKVSKVENPEVNTPAYKIKEYISQVCDVLTSSISKPLFYNAKNEDYTHDAKRMPVELGARTSEYLAGIIETIRGLIPKHYKNEVAKVKSGDYEKEIIKLIKSSSAYKEREDKTIYAADIIDMRKELLAELRRNRASDQATIVRIQEAMEQTIKKYGVLPKPAKTAKNSSSKA